jgi:cupin 2 domain-containing protein
VKINFFNNIPNSLPKEVFETIIQTENLKIERIISKGQKSEESFWYDQDQAEFVSLLKGKARIQFETQTVELAAGDYLNIAAHQKHRVE